MFAGAAGAAARPPRRGAGRYAAGGPLPADSEATQLSASIDAMCPHCATIVHISPPALAWLRELARPLESNRLTEVDRLIREAALPQKDAKALVFRSEEHTSE